MSEQHRRVREAIQRGEAANYEAAEYDDILLERLMALVDGDSGRMARLIGDQRYHAAGVAYARAMMDREPDDVIRRLMDAYVDVVREILGETG